ncbi:ABC transporter substrate-binding protein [Kitasatospora nipponensis]|uniref:ABC transporter substrate-binding protein n=1 Tax=Kitasatospora nipponensis TaxID=258049 RepID=A0ABN1WLH5_9ACTN
MRAGRVTTGARRRSAPARAALALLLVALSALTACGGSGSGPVVHILGTWTGDEQKSFLAVVAPFERRTGIRVDYQGSPDAATVLADRVASGSPPDLAVLSSPGQLAPYARAGRLTPLDGVLDRAALNAQYSPSWLQLGAVDGRQFAVVVKASLKSLLWYSPRALAAHGWTPPATWDQLTATDRQITAAGGTPWCVGLEASSASGWPGTDWLEDIVLAQSGPDVYDQWVAGKLAWTSAPIRLAWQTWGAVVAAAGQVRGGPRGMLQTSFGAGGGYLLADRPACYFDHEASFITGYYRRSTPQGGAPGAPPPKAGQDFAFSRFPTITPAFSGDEEIGGDLLGLFHDTPAARQLLDYLTAPEAQGSWVSRGGTLSPNRQVPATAYPDDLTHQLGQLLADAPAVRFDASDLMPDALRDAFYQAVLAYVSDPSQLDTLLTDLDRVRATVQP